MTGSDRRAHRFPSSGAAIAAMFLAALLINVYGVPLDGVDSSLYTIPVLVAAHRLSPPGIAVVGACAVGFYLYSAQAEARPLAVWPLGVLALGAVTYLATLFADQREKATRHAREVEDHRRLQEFVGMVGHDLAGALTGVLGYAEVLEHSAGDPSSLRRLQTQTSIHGAARRMRRLIDDLRDAASIGGGHLTIRRAPMDLVRLLERVVSEQQVTAGQHRLSIDATTEVKGCWDEERLGQLLTNLISNALKYSPPTGQVRVVVREDHGEAVVTVSDDGRGIPSEQQELLFRPFFRGVPPNEEVAGMGLGLYIAKAVADAHGGRIRVHSAPGCGTTFSVALPLSAGPDDPCMTQIATRPTGA